MKKIVAYFSLLFILTTAYTQEGNNWYFGNYAGLSFNYPTPKALHDGALSTFEGCATISDKNGQLLFYTNGLIVWNKNHQPMPNGTGLYGDSSSANAAIIIPKPGSETIYYIFTADSQENQNVKGYNYSEVDITLDNGLGNITANKNILLHAPSSEKLTAVRHANGSDIWVITHGWGNNLWSVYKVSCNGVNPVPVQSAVGSIYQQTLVINGHIYNSGSVGCLKSSPDGKKIATTSNVTSRWEIFDFDNITGQISNGLSFYEYQPYGIEFSSNSKFVYVSTTVAGRDSSAVEQYDVSAYDSTSIASSLLVIGKTYTNASPFYNAINALQLGPDDKIYCANRETSLLSVINAPNNKGSFCNYANEQIDLEGAICTLGLPVFFAGLITNKNISFDFTAAGDCATVDFFGTSSITNITQWFWDFGDGQTATGQNVSHTYITGNEYNARLTVTVNNICGSGTASAAKKINLKRLKPKSAFSFDAKCGDNTLLFTDSSTITTGNIIQWQWDFGDGYTANVASPSHSYIDYKAYTVSLITTSDGACNGSDTLKKTVSLHAKPSAKVDIHNACVNKRVLFTDISTVQNDTIAGRFWVFNDGQKFSDKIVERQFNTAGMYNFKMTVQSGFGCVSDTLYTSFAIEAVPQVAFSIENACVDSLVSFKDESTVATGDITQWFWDFGDGYASVQQQTQHQFANAGDHVIKLVATTTQQCSSDTVTKLIQVDAKPIAAFSAAAGCVGKVIIPQNQTALTIGTISEFLWDTGQGFTSAGEKPSLIFNTSGDHLVRMFVKSTQGCVSAVAEQTINIQSNPVADFSFGNTCAGKAIPFTNTSTNSAEVIEKWFWDFADGNNSTTFEPAHTYNQFGNYAISLKATTKNGCSDTTSKTITIAKVNIYAGNDTLVAISQPLQLAGSGAKDYQWRPTAYLNDPFINNPVAILPVDMSYYLTGITTEGCVGYDTINIKVYKGPDMYVPTAFTPNGDKTNDVFKPIMPGIKQLINFSVYNRWGQLVYATNTIGQGWNGKFNGKAVPIGVYVWKLSAVDYNNKRWNRNGSVTVIR